MRFLVFDIETDGLEATKIHCLAFQLFEDLTPITSGVIIDHSEIVTLLNSVDYIVGHNIVRYDIPTIERLSGSKITTKRIDTLALSWYLFPWLKEHGLEFWGTQVGVKKPEIEDWENLSLEEYIHRCKEDVLINSELFLHFRRELFEIYQNDSWLNICNYFSFKLDCLREQEEVGITLNRPLAEKHLQVLEKQLEEKTAILSNAMPKELGIVIKKKPTVMFKKDGTLSARAISWIEYLKKNNLPLETEAVVDPPNPGSHSQLKSWLELLDWKPITFKKSKATGEKVPQISLPFGGGICSSVKDLYKKEPTLQELEGYYQIKHRIGIFKSYLSLVDEKGKVYARANGFTKTHRLMHSAPIVNLPKPGVFFGKECREVLTVPSDKYLMIGSDASGLEDNTKRHWLFKYDPEYVKEQMAEGFDAHIEIGVLAGLISEEDAEFFKNPPTNLSKEDELRLKKIKKSRSIAKSANFASTYGAGIPKIAETAKISLKDATLLYDTYWKRNWAIKEVEKDTIIKVVRKKTWLYNPLSGFWLFLSSEKDKFSALNQNSGVYIIDLWIKKCREKLNPLGLGISLQYHDEISLSFPRQYQKIVENILTTSMKEVNKELNLNVEIGISIDTGINYSEVH